MPVSAPMASARPRRPALRCCRRARSPQAFRCLGPLRRAAPPRGPTASRSRLPKLLPGGPRWAWSTCHDPATGYSPYMAPPAAGPFSCPAAPGRLSPRAGCLSAALLPAGPAPAPGPPTRQWDPVRRPGSSAAGSERRLAYTHPGAALFAQSELIHFRPPVQTPRPGPATPPITPQYSISTRPPGHVMLSPQRRTGPRTAGARSSTDRAFDYGSKGCRFESCRARSSSKAPSSRRKGLFASLRPAQSPGWLTAAGGCTSTVTGSDSPGPGAFVIMPRAGYGSGRGAEPRPSGGGPGPDGGLLSPLRRPVRRDTKRAQEGLQGLSG